MAGEALKTAKKRVAVFLDGTWNTVGDNTNVWRLRALCAPVGADGIVQRSYYSTGVGTRFGESIRGGMFGYGLNKNITDAYEWLIENYEEEDDLFIFGFSRGAYTARSLAGLIALCGLLKPGAPLSVNQLFKRYKRGGDPKTIWKLLELHQAGERNFSLEEQWMISYSAAVPIKFIGVFDTVGSLGNPIRNMLGVTNKKYQFLHTGLRISQQHVFHAVAIDDHRQAFLPTLWTKSTPTDPNAPTAAPRSLDRAEQRWFAGAHANVGGGCESDLLAQIPLKWLRDKAALHGLAFRDDVNIYDEAHKAPISDSFSEFMYGLYKLLRFGRRYHRHIGQIPRVVGENIETSVNETIDASVFRRWREDENYRPKGIIEWSKRAKVDPATLTDSIRADDPKTAVR